MKVPTKAELLAKYAEPNRDVHTFCQIDGFFVPGSWDPIVSPDEDGDCIFYNQNHEIRASGSDLAVRVQIHQGTRPEDAKRILEKMLTIVERALEFCERPANFPWPGTYLPLGEVIVTPAAHDVLERFEVVTRNLLNRHSYGDYGDMSPEDAEVNAMAAKGSSPVHSVYRIGGEDGEAVEVYVITAGDRSHTTIMLPDEY